MNNENQADERDGHKESLADRLRFLIGNRSTRAAAKSWRLSYSTLNNYINRGTEPSLSIAAQIAELEGVSVEWLAWGERTAQAVPLVLEQSVAHYPSTSPTANDPLQFAWYVVFSSLDRSEQEALLKLIHTEGVKGILHDVQLRSAVAEKLATLTPAEREQFYQRALKWISTLESGRKSKA